MNIYLIGRFSQYVELFVSNNSIKCKAEKCYVLGSLKYYRTNKNAS